jgi:UDP-glucose 4-epimerase
MSSIITHQEKDQSCSQKNEKGNRILIVGGTGFIGAHVARFMAGEGHEVFLFDPLPPSPAIEWMLSPYSPNIHYLKGSITDLPVLLRALSKYAITWIVNTSAVTDLEVLVNQPLTAHQVMVQGHLHLMEAVRLTAIKRVVVTSSIGVYAPVQYEPMDERHPVLLPNEGPTIASYSSWKLAIESSGLFYYAYHGVDCLFLRLSAVYGFGMRYPLYVKPFVEESLLGRPVRFETGGDMKRDYTYIEDVVRGINLALHAPSSLSYRIYNITSGEDMISASQVADVVKELIPNADIEIKGGLSEFEKHDMKNRGKLSIQLAERELGYKPCFKFPEGLRNYIQQHKEFLEAKSLSER